MPSTIYKTPGVYIRELSAFPPSIVGVDTAVPGFVGYTEKAEIRKKPVYLQPIKIGSMAEYESIFGTGYKALYDIKDVTPPAGEPALDADKYDFTVFDSDTKSVKFYKLVPYIPLVTQSAAPGSRKALAAEDLPPIPFVNARFNLYNSLRLFYANGGGTCYIVSCGSYSKTTDVKAEELQAGIKVLREQQGPTMLVVPDLVLLKPKDPVEPWVAPPEYGDTVKLMLDQCGVKQDRVAVIDVYGGNEVKTSDQFDKVKEDFRAAVGDTFLSYGMSYFPFLYTSVVPASEVNYQNIAEGTFPLFKDVLKMQAKNLYPDDAKRKPVDDLIDRMTAYPLPPVNPPEVGPLTTTQLDQNLNSAIPLLGDIESNIVGQNSVLPPSGAMAGVYTANDALRGVWNAPANITLAGVIQPTYLLTGDQQADMNVPLDGKAIDAIREFVGRGSVVWGARTLDGNSNDYRYIQVRRTLIYIEQSIKTALNQFVFAANDGNTWTTVVAMCSSFLQQVWSQGGLMGATPAEAFAVQCGVGSTMTTQDILDGYMRVQVVLQMIRPAEFIELTFTQKMEGAA